MEGRAAGPSPGEAEGAGRQLVLSFNPLKSPHISPPRRFASPFRYWFRSGVIWQRALATRRAKGVLGCVKHSANKGDHPAVVSAGVASPGILCSLGLCSYIQRTKSKLVKAVSCEKQLRTSGLPEEKEAEGCSHSLYGFLRRRSGDEVLISLVFSGFPRVHGNDSKLQQKRFRAHIRKHFFSGRVVKHWNRLSREVVEAPSLAAFKRYLDNVLNNML